MNTPMHMTLAQAAQWLSDATVVGDGAVTVDRVHTDTRTLQPGDLFVALRGERFDAHDFLAQARAAGATAALCERPHLAALGWQGIEVADSRRALGELAAGWRRQFVLPLIAVTGSNGKTTTTQMIASILHAAAGEAALATQGNLNNDIGVPLTLLRLRPSHRLAVVELGMNHPGEMAVLAAMAQPTVALVNNAQREHQEFMGTVEAVARENGESIAALPADGVAVYPADEPYTGIWKTLAGARRSLTFAADAASGADVHAVEAVWQDAAWQVRAATPQGPLHFRLQVAGRHNVRNALAATACALAAGVPLSAIAAGLDGFAAVQGRSRVVAARFGGHALTVVDDTYNANPDSVRAAIDVLAELPGPRVLVLGDMGEVGDQGPAFHAEIGAYAATQGIDHVLTLGALARHAAAACPGARACGDDAEAGLSVLLDALRGLLPGCASVLVKGSRFMRMERVLAVFDQPAQHKDAPCCLH